MEYSGARGTLIHEKKLKSKILCQTPFNGAREGIEHKVFNNTKHSVCPLVGIGTPRIKGWGTLACGWGVGESQFRRREKKLGILPTLWYRSSEKREWQGRVETGGFLVGEGIGVQREGKKRAEWRLRDS